MKLTVLADNNVTFSMQLLGEHGLCFYMEDGDERILLDTGYSGVFMQNAQKLGIDVDRVTKVVLSHGHDDHSRGLRAFLAEPRDVELIAHPRAFNFKSDRRGGYSGAPFTAEEAAERCRLTLTDGPLPISEHLTYLGQIPSVMPFEPRYSMGLTFADGRPALDYMTDDSALVYRGREGLTVITGCSHSGICNIIEYAKRVLGDDRVVGVIGGFHLREKGERLDKTVAYLKESRIPNLYPCHCVALCAKTAMAAAMEIGELGVGTVVEIE